MLSVPIIQVVIELFLRRGKTDIGLLMATELTAWTSSCKLRIGLRIFRCQQVERAVVPNTGSVCFQCLKRCSPCKMLFLVFVILLEFLEHALYESFPNVF